MSPLITHQLSIRPTAPWQVLTNNKFNAQILTWNPTGNSRCHGHVPASRALSMSCSFGLSARLLESRIVVICNSWWMQLDVYFLTENILMMYHVRLFILLYIPENIPTVLLCFDCCGYAISSYGFIENIYQYFHDFVTIWWSSWLCRLGFFCNIRKMCLS